MDVVDWKNQDWKGFVMNGNAINHALREMAKSPNGGYATSAAMLGLSLAALENRLYEVKGQQISIEQAMLLQKMTERCDFAEAVAMQSGGVFVSLPELDAAALAGEDILVCFARAVERLGDLSQQWRAVTDDGRVSREENAAIFRAAYASVREVLGIAVLTERVFGDFADGIKESE